MLSCSSRMCALVQRQPKNEARFGAIPQVPAQSASVATRTRQPALGGPGRYADPVGLSLWGLQNGRAVMTSLCPWRAGRRGGSSRRDQSPRSRTRGLRCPLLLAGRDKEHDDPWDSS